MEWIPVTDRMPKASDEMTHDDDVLVSMQLPVVAE